MDFVESVDEQIRPASQDLSGGISVGAARRPLNVSDVASPSPIDRAGEDFVGYRVVEFDDERHDAG